MTTETPIQVPSAPTTIRRILFTTAAQVDFARRLCEALADGDAGKGMFSCPLSADGTEPPTHFICGGHISGSFDTALSDPNILHYVCSNHIVAQEGDDDLSDVTLPMCQALLDASIVSDGTYEAEVEGEMVTRTEDVHGFIARQNLQIVRTTLEI